MVLGKGDIDRIYEAESESRQRLARWMSLGSSIATLLQVPDTTEFIHCLAQLLEEYDFYFSNAAYQGMVMLGNKMSGGVEDEAARDGGAAVKPRVRTHMRHLETRMVNFTLDPRQVVTALCDVLACTFRRPPHPPLEPTSTRIHERLEIRTSPGRFMDPVCAEHGALFDAILKLDQLFADHFIGHLGERVAQAAHAVLQQDLGSVRGLLDGLASEGKPAAAVYGASHGPNDHSLA